MHHFEPVISNLSFRTCHSEPVIPKQSFQICHSEPAILNLSFRTCDSEAITPNLSFPICHFITVIQNLSLSNHSQSVIPNLSFHNCHSKLVTLNLSFRTCQSEPCHSKPIDEMSVWICLILQNLVFQNSGPALFLFIQYTPFLLPKAEQIDHEAWPYFASPIKEKTN